MSDTALRPAPYVRPDVKGFLDFLAMAGGPTMSEMGAEGARLSYLQMSAVAEMEPRALAVIKDLTCPGPAGEIPLRFYDARETREPGPAVMFYHGGGFVIGDLDSHHALCTEIAAGLDLPVIAVHYRLAPEHPFPAAVVDAWLGYWWLIQQGFAPEHIVVAGDSAGGGLALALVVALRDAVKDVYLDYLRRSEGR